MGFIRTTKKEISNIENGNNYSSNNNSKNDFFDDSDFPLTEVENDKQLMNFSITDSNAMIEFYIVYPDDNESNSDFGFYFPYLRHDDPNDNRSAVFHWDATVLPSENYNMKKTYILNPEASNVEKVPLLPYFLIDKEMDGFDDIINTIKKDDLGNFWDKKNISKEELKKADMVFLTNKGVLHFMSWTDIRKKMKGKGKSAMSFKKVMTVFLRQHKDLSSRFFTNVLN